MRLGIVHQESQSFQQVQGQSCLLHQILFLRMHEDKIVPKEKVVQIRSEAIRLMGCNSVSAQLRRFFSWKADPEAEATDAFSQNWSTIRGFAHPPWCLIAKQSLNYNSAWKKWEG